MVNPESWPIYLWGIWRICIYLFHLAQQNLCQKTLWLLNYSILTWMVLKDSSHQPCRFFEKGYILFVLSQASGKVVKNLSANAGDIRDLGLIPGSGRFPWRRAWQPTPVFLPGESPWTEEPGRLRSIGSQRARYNWNYLAHTDSIFKLKHT